VRARNSARWLIIIACLDGGANASTNGMPFQQLIVSRPVAQ
jgi:hypothetical protein